MLDSPHPHGSLNDRAALRGRPTISYLRFSTAPQELGTSIDRQQETLDRIISHFGLVLDHSLTDRALSASKGHHHSRGKLADLITAIDAGVIRRGTVLAIEAYDRLDRRGTFDAFDLLKKLIVDGGMVIIDGDLTVWDAHTINSDLNHKLIANMNAARSYAERLGQYARGAHRRVRTALETLVDDPDAVKPMFQSRPPAWIEKIPAVGKVPAEYRLIDAHVKTIKLIFHMCVEGYTIRQISAHLNKAEVPTHVRAVGWSGARVGSILRDEHVLGYAQSHFRQPDAGKVVDGKKIPARRVAGRKVLLYPPAIDAATWQRARDALSVRALVAAGRPAPGVNLFSGRIKCKACGGPMRLQKTGPLDHTGVRQRRLFCGSRMERGTCRDTASYDLGPDQEGSLLARVMAVTALATSAATPDTSGSAERLAALQVEIAVLEESITTYGPKTGSSPTIFAMVVGMAESLDAKRAEAHDLGIKASALSIADPQGSSAAWVQFVEALVVPALDGEIEARERLRSLLARVEFTIVGDDAGALQVMVGGRVVNQLGIAVALGMGFGVDTGMDDAEIERLSYMTAGEFRTDLDVAKQVAEAIASTNA